MKIQAVVWVDHEQARIFYIHHDRIEEAQPLQDTRHEGPGGPDGAEARLELFHEVARALGGVEELLIVGPSTEKLELLNYLNQHDQALAQRVVGVERVDEPEGELLLALARRSFKASVAALPAAATALKAVPRSAVALSAVAVACAAAASIITIVWGGAFPDPSPASMENGVLAEARGWSGATLLVALPLTISALWAAVRGSLRGRLIWFGGLVYLVYTYLEFAVSPPFTALYLLYIAAFACALPALLLGVTSIETSRIAARFGDRAPRRPVAIFSILFASLLALAWLKGIAGQTLAGAFGWPLGEAAVQHVVHALDLGLQAPLGIAAGVALLRRRPSGLLLAAIMLVNVVCMGAALTGMVLCSSADAQTSTWIAAPFALVWLIGVALAIAFFRAGAPQGLRAGDA